MKVLELNEQERRWKAMIESPIGLLTVRSDGVHIIGLELDSQAKIVQPVCSEIQRQKQEGPALFQEVLEWLDRYFSGENPGAIPKILLYGTPFQEAVWECLQEIPYGETVSYGEVAEQVAKKRGKAQMAPQAVGTAIGQNPIAILVPCHRVIGADFKLHGYAAGIEKKAWLLRLEGCYFCN